MNTRKILAWAILIIVYLFPFRYAYLSPPDTGKWSMMNFLLTATGCIIFAILMYRDEDSKSNSGT